MQRDTSVLLMTVVESADAIADAVDREFITIGEALNNLSRDR